ncbi:MAG: hypothetical protein ACRDPK_08495 [Carbonactinosporaceae bacterium]
MANTPPSETDIAARGAVGDTMDDIPAGAVPPAGDEHSRSDAQPGGEGAGVTGEPASAAGVPRFWVLILVLLLVLAAAATGFLGYRVRAASQTDEARTEALAAAKANASKILAYDHRHLDEDFAAARKVTTGKFRNDYTKTTSTLKPTATDIKAVVKADVVASSVVSAEPDRVVVLLFVNQITTSNRLDAPRVDLNRVRMGLEQVDGTWLVSDVDAL